jgi:hypothetical protein
MLIEHMFDVKAAPARYTRAVLFMVIERFKNADPKPIGERFERLGRQLPDGLIYHASWVDASGMRCYQVMEAPSAGVLETWIARWDDLVDFEIVPVSASADFWATVNSKSD